MSGVGEIIILLPVKFRWTPFSGFREDVENVSNNQMPGRFSWCLDQLEKQKRGRGRWYLAFCQASLQSRQRMRRRSRNYPRKSEAKAKYEISMFFTKFFFKAILVFRSARKTQTCYRTLRSCFLSYFDEFRSEISERNSKMAQQIKRPGRPYWFFDRPENHTLDKGQWDFASG